MFIPHGFTSIVANLSGDFCDGTLKKGETEICLDNTVNDLSSINRRGESLLVVGIMMIVTCLLMILYAAHARQRFLHEIILLDEQEITITDFTLHVSNLPRDVSEMELKQFFETSPILKELVEDSYQVMKVVICYENLELNECLEKYCKLKRDICYLDFERRGIKLLWPLGNKKRQKKEIDQEHREKFNALVATGARIKQIERTFNQHTGNAFVTINSRKGEMEFKIEVF
jgi:hypothetical protein